MSMISASLPCWCHARSQDLYTSAHEYLTMIDSGFLMPHTESSMACGRVWRREVMVMAAAGQEGGPVPDLYPLLGVPRVPPAGRSRGRGGGGRRLSTRTAGRVTPLPRPGSVP